MNRETTEIRFVYWQDGPFWMGYLEDFPDYMIQDVSMDELRESLAEICRDLTSGEIEKVRRVGSLQIA